MSARALLAASLAIACAQADAAGIVRRCTVDVDPAATSSNMDLARALSAGGSVAFACPSGSVIRITRAHDLAAGTSIDGGGRITLDARGVTAMFHSSATGAIFLNRITLRNGASSFGFHGNGLEFAGLIFGPFRLVMTDVNVENTRSPIAVASADIRGGSFSGNTGTVVRTRNLVISRRARFQNNNAIPFAPPSAAPNVVEVGERAVIENATFSGNRGSVWRGLIAVKASTFVNNGSDDADGGALSLEGDGRVEKSEFINNSASRGGAVFVRRGVLDVRRVRFRGNRAHHSGGAIHLGAEVHQLGWEGIPGGSALRLSYSHFNDNLATDGGAVALLQDSHSTQQSLVGKLVNFAGNTATRTGGAISGGDARVELARAVFVQNSAASYGGAIAMIGLRFDDTRLGNVLMVRNKAATGGGYYGSRVELVHSTVADNAGGGIRISVPADPFMSAHRGAVRLVNSIVANNDLNCPPAQDQADILSSGSNLQFPRTTCGSSAASENPHLDSMYVPALGSAARYKGEPAVCVGHSLVLGKDVYGESRDTGTKCTLGAVERDLQRHALKALQANREAQQSPVGKFLAVLGVKRYAADR